MAIYSKLDRTMNIHAKYLAIIVGKITSISVVIGPVARLMTRNLYGLQNTHQTCCDMLTVAPQAPNASLQGNGGYTMEPGCYIAKGHSLASV